MLCPIAALAGGALAPVGACPADRELLYPGLAEVQPAFSVLFGIPYGIGVSGRGVRCGVGWLSAAWPDRRDFARLVVGVRLPMPQRGAERRLWPAWSVRVMTVPMAAS